MTERSTDSIIPVFVNLKELTRQAEDAIDRQLIERFILNYLNRVNDRDVEEFLEEEFQQGVRDGTWIFLFDSFDEIPEVLSSVEADSIIQQYGEAISDFLYGMNKCRGVIASRHFRGPGKLGWPRFRVLPLSAERRMQLIRNAGFSREKEVEMIGFISSANYGIRHMTGNPMFLGLLCEHVRTRKAFPENAHSVFESYIQLRLSRDTERLGARYSIDSATARLAAENVAYCMSVEKEIGLSPTREQLHDALARYGLELGDNYGRCLDALEYLKLARGEQSPDTDNSMQFTFSHRRLQEYFATCKVLSTEVSIEPELLLSDARWRETSVVLLQTQSIDALPTLIAQVEESVAGMLASIESVIDNPIEYLQNRKAGVYRDLSSPVELANAQLLTPSMIHLLGILQEGFGGHQERLPKHIRDEIGKLVLSVHENAPIFGQKECLENAGVVQSEILVHIMRNALQSRSQWIKEGAFRQIQFLRGMPNDIAGWIRTSLVNSCADGRLSSEKYETRALLMRAPSAEENVRIMNLLLTSRYIDIIVSIALGMAIAVAYGSQLSSPLPAFMMTLAAAYILAASHISLFHRARMFKGNRTDIVNSLWLVMVVMMRLFSFGLALMISLGLSHSAAIVLSAVGIYGLSWAPAAFLCSLRAKYTRYRWWPILPVVSISIFGEGMYAAAVVIRQVGIRNTLSIFWRPLAVVLVSILLQVMAILGFAPAFAGLTPIIIVGSAALIAGMYFNWLPKIQDHFEWKRWEKSTIMYRGSDELWSDMWSFRSSLYVTRFYHHLRTTNRIVANANTTQFIEALLIFVEEQLRNNIVLVLPKMNPLEESNESWNEDRLTFRGKLAKRQIKSNQLDYRLVDELCLLRDHLRRNLAE